MGRKTRSLRSTRSILSRWNKYYSTEKFGLGVECCSCGKWRRVTEYEESYQVPEDWNCSMSYIDGKKGDCSIPSTLTSEDFVSEEYVPGSLVWAKCTSYPWWPAMVEDDPDEEEYHRTVVKDKEEYHVVFLTDKPQCVRRAWIAAKNLLEYVNPPKRNFVAKKNWARPLQLSKEIADIALPMSLSQRLKKFSFAQLASRKFPVLKKDVKTPKILAKKNERGQTVSAIANKRRRHASAGDTMNGAATKVPRIGFTAEDAASVSNTTVPEIGHNVESTTSVPEVSHTIEVYAGPSQPQTGAGKAIVTGVQTSNLLSTIDTTKQMNGASEDLNSEDIDMDAFEKELELYTDDELPSSPESKESLPEYLRNKKLEELFSDCMSESDSLESVDDLALPYYRECDSDHEQSPEKEPIKEKFVLSEEDIRDINNPNLRRTHVWQKGFH